MFNFILSSVSLKNQSFCMTLHFRLKCHLIMSILLRLDQEGMSPLLIMVNEEVEDVGEVAMDRW